MVRGDLKKRSAGFDRLFFAYHYANPIVNALIGNFKYDHNMKAGDALEVLIQRWVMKYGVSIHEVVLVPVPLYTKRMKQRGFNQAERLAEMMAMALGLEVRNGLLARGKDTKPQSAEGTDRKKNVEKAFHAPNAVDGTLQYLIVDDVWTSGATMKACAKALKKAGARRVSGFTLALAKAQKSKKTDSPRKHKKSQA